MHQLAIRQHGVVTRGQLLDLGFSAHAIKHRLATHRLHPRWRGVYAVGRRELSAHGRWMAAVLSCGPRAALSHRSAAALWELCREPDPIVEVSVPVATLRLRPGILVHRRLAIAADDITQRHGIPVTSPVCTLVDIAANAPRGRLEAAVNEADKRDLIDPEQLRRALAAMKPRAGTAQLRRQLDRETFAVTESELERRFLPLARQAGLGVPRTGVYVNGFKVDFFWPDLGLVVETDGLRYHRTPSQQARDRLRDQAHAASGLRTLRFTHAQVWYDSEHVRSTLAAVAAHG